MSVTEIYDLSNSPLSGELGSVIFSVHPNSPSAARVMNRYLFISDVKD
jgi:hypothetical protein